MVRLWGCSIKLLVKAHECRLITLLVILSPLKFRIRPKPSAQADKKLWHFQFISRALSLSIHPGKAKCFDAPGVLLTAGPQLESCFSSLKKICPHHINPHNLQCHWITSSSPKWLQSKCWLPCPSEAWRVHISVSFEETVIQTGCTCLWNACLHYHISFYSVSFPYSVLSALISPPSLWDWQHPHLQK